jgi:oxygen-independent coproporphyrinogen-3 oxidase
MHSLAVIPPAPESLARLATRGPRYTSYPPAPHFKADFGDTEARAELAASVDAAQTAGISLYAHVPFCSKLCWYCGCNVQITRDRNRGRSYIDTLLKEIQLYGELLPDCKLAELSLGGGSPNFLDEESLRRLADGVRKVFPARPDAVLGIELDPRDTRIEQVQALAAMGFRRLSVGVQDFEKVVQDTINRHQSYEQTAELILHARQVGFNSAGIDLVYGLPGQTEESFTNTLQSIVTIAPDRIALFGYAHLPHVLKHQKLVEREPIPDISARAALLTRAIEELTTAGYIRVGFDHFALPGDPLAEAVQEGKLHRNFQGFTVPRGGPLLACGVTGISDTGGAYWQNITKIDDWQEAIEAGRLPIARGLKLGDDDKLRRHLINRLMCDSKLDFQEVEDRFGIDFPSYFAYELRELEKPEQEGLATVDLQVGTIEPTPLGFELIRNLCMVFDRHLRGKEPAGSTTI